MDKDRLERLLVDLKRSNDLVRDRATAALWHEWFHQKGVHGAQQLIEAQTLLDAGRIGEAETLLSSILNAQPDFIEAWNRRAVLHFTKREYWKAIADCQKVIELAPHHFGALHGLGLSHRAVGNYTAAIQAFRQALAVQPYALVNQRLILECTAQLG
ncbi:MAG: tetratricopeptide repeat protein [Cyanobacteria bacterium P01_D01_bin.36]